MAVLLFVPDTRTNSLLIAGVEEDIYTAEKTIQYLDRPKRQVSIEVSLIEMSRTDAQNFGITLGADAKAFSGAFNSVPDASTGSIGGNPPVITPNGYVYPVASGGPSNIPSWIGSSTIPASLAKTIGLATATGSSAIQVSTIKNLTSNMVMRIEAQLQKDKLKLIANPNVMILDGTEALIKLTEQIVNRVTVTTTSTGTVTASQQLADVGVVLNVLPRVTDDGHVTMRIRPSVTTPGETKTYNFTGASYEITLINTREVMVEDVRVKSGETIALGGLVRERSRSTDRRVPFLGDIPMLGALFRQNSNAKEKTELVVLITPKIIEDVGTQTRPLVNPNQSIVPVD